MIHVVFLLTSLLLTSECSKRPGEYGEFGNFCTVAAHKLPKVWTFLITPLTGLSRKLCLWIPINKNTYTALLHGFYNSFELFPRLSPNAQCYSLVMRYQNINESASDY